MKDWVSHLALKAGRLNCKIQGVNAEKAFTSQRIKNCRIARVGREVREGEVRTERLKRRRLKRTLAT